MKNHEVYITPMQLDDEPRVHSLIEQLNVETYASEDRSISQEAIAATASTRTPEERRERLEARLDDPSNQALVARIDDIVVGFAAPRIQGGVRRVGALYVDKEYQGRGVSGVLMREILTWHNAKENSIELEVVEYNERAKAFYRKWGFREDGRKGVFRSLIPTVYMTREPGEYK